MGSEYVKSVADIFNRVCEQEDRDVSDSAIWFRQEVKWNLKQNRDVMQMS